MLHRAMARREPMSPTDLELRFMVLKYFSIFLRCFGVAAAGMLIAANVIQKRFSLTNAIATVVDGVY